MKKVTTLITLLALGLFLVGDVGCATGGGGGGGGGGDADQQQPDDGDGGTGGGDEIDDGAGGGDGDDATGGDETADGDEDQQDGDADQGDGTGAVEQTFAGIEFVWCPPGTFSMGSDHDPVVTPEELPVHQVTLTQGFWIGKYEITQAQWEAVMGENPSLPRQVGPDRPVDSVSWDDVQNFLVLLNDQSGETFRLPSEAEWEYACRAGTTTEWCFGNDPGDFSTDYLPISDYAWNDGNGDPDGDGVYMPSDVGLLMPNDWGIYDMHGNVKEWCQDWYGDYPAGPVTDPQGPENGETRVNRGGAHWMFPEFLRSARRSNDYPGSTADDRGFRLVRPE